MIIALRTYIFQNNLKSGKGPLTMVDLLKIVQRYEETGTVEDHVKSERPCLRNACLPRVAVEMET